MFCQNIQGIVYDEKKQPIAGALVYLDGSSIGVLTNDNGWFEIEVHTKIFTNLIVNHTGYEPFSIKNPFTHSLHTININLNCFAKNSSVTLSLQNIAKF
jgi:hypothetical protein